MRILHIASFTGNIGDIINHEGFYSNILKKGVDVEKLEIRKFYKNAQELCFNQSLLSYINTYDALILGGGGFFDVRWDDSPTGTTLEMDDHFIDDIKIPVLVNAMGVHIDYDKAEAIRKFNSFILKVCCLNNWMITLRNDGSLSRLKHIVNASDLNIAVVPDNGFAFKPLSSVKESNIVGLSITNDLFSPRFNGSITSESFNEKMVSLCDYILRQGNEIMFFLHAPQDLDVLHFIYKKLGNERFRNGIKVAPFDTYTKENANSINMLYSKCKYIIAMRFHANVIALKNIIPVIGLAGHEQISGIYNEINLPNQCVVIRDGFYDNLINMIDSINSNPKVYMNVEKTVMDIIESKQHAYSKLVNSFLENRNCKEV